MAVSCTRRPPESNAEEKEEEPSRILIDEDLPQHNPTEVLIAVVFGVSLQVLAGSYHYCGTFGDITF